MSYPTVKFRVIEAKGHRMHEMPVHEAVPFIINYVQTNKAWFYLDGKVLKVDGLTEAQLTAASMVTITNILGGGMGAPV